MNNDDVAILPLVVLLATHMFTPRYTKIVEGQSQCTPKWMIFWKFSNSIKKSFCRGVWRLVQFMVLLQIVGQPSLAPQLMWKVGWGTWLPRAVVLFGQLYLPRDGGAVDKAGCRSITLNRQVMTALNIAHGDRAITVLLSLDKESGNPPMDWIANRFKNSIVVF